MTLLNVTVIDFYDVTILKRTRQGSKKFFFGLLHVDVSIKEHPGNLTIFCLNTLPATAYQLVKHLGHY